MGRTRRSGRVGWALGAVGVLGVAGGCAAAPDARYVYQDGDYGVIGVPRNSPYGKKDYGAQVRELMTRHFPEGFEVVRAEEVVAGERTLDTAIKKELETDPGFTAFSQALKLGKLARSSAIDEKDVTHITESRIIYRRKVDGVATGTDGFARVTNQAPPLYLDPNDIARKADKDILLAAAKKLDEKPADAKPAEKKGEVAANAPGKDGAVARAGHDKPAENP